MIVVFILFSVWWRRIIGLWKLLDGIDWLRGELGLVLMGRAMLSKSLIQFSVDGWSCVPSLLFTWGQTMVEVMKIMVIPLKRSHIYTATLSAPNPAAGHHWPRPPLETPGQSQASPGQSLVGSLLLSLGFWCIRFWGTLQESISQSSVSSGSSIVGLMVTSSKRAYGIPKSAAPRAPVPVADHHQSGTPQFSSVQSLCHVRLFVTPWTTAHQASLSITNSQSPPEPMSIESVLPSNHFILCRTLLLLPSIFPSIRVFSNESALHIRWPKYVPPQEMLKYISVSVSAGSLGCDAHKVCLSPLSISGGNGVWF